MRWLSCLLVLVCSGLHRPDVLWKPAGSIYLSEMWSASSDSETTRPLRSGLTTGSCATACAVAAARLLLSGQTSSSAFITLPKGKVVSLDIVECFTEQQANTLKAQAGTIKDAGDDPDVTHGARVFVELALRPEPGVSFSAGKGVGTVTRDGLLLAVGEPAINPVPRQMMREHLQQEAETAGYSGGFAIAVGVEDGEQLAQKTMNPRLGILGGLSILGTTGIVRPFSCAAYIASIHQGIDVARANGYQHLAATTGNRSEQAVQGIYPELSDTALIEMGDYVGAVLKHIKKNTVQKLTLCGGFGKISKLANGYLDLHSAKSSVDLEFLSQLAAEQGADNTLQALVQNSNTSVEALKHCQSAEIDLAKAVCLSAWNKACSIVPDTVNVEVLVINRPGQIVGRYP